VYQIQWLEREMAATNVLLLLCFAHYFLMLRLLQLIGFRVFRSKDIWPTDISSTQCLDDTGVDKSRQIKKCRPNVCRRNVFRPNDAKPVNCSEMNDHFASKWPGAWTIKLFCNKLECLSLTVLSSQGSCFWVRPGAYPKRCLTRVGSNLTDKH
jgi:hypothetical protein